MSARIGELTLLVSPADLASKQGRGDAAGRRYLKSLKVEGLIEIRENAGGRWRVVLCDPNEVAIARRVVIGDVQLEMFGDELSGLDAEPPPPHDAAGGRTTDGLSGPAATVPFRGKDALAKETADVESLMATPRPPSIASPSDVAPDLAPDVASEVAPPPTAASPARNLGTSDGSKSLPTSVTSEAPSKHSESEVPKTSRDNRGVGRDATSDGPPPTLGDAVNAYFARPPRPEPTPADVELEIVRLRRAVNDPRLKTTPLVRIAKAVVGGLLPVREVEELINQLDGADRRGELKRDNCPRFAYFVGAMRDRIFPRYDLPWPKPK